MSDPQLETDHTAQKNDQEARVDKRTDSPLPVTTAGKNEPTPTLPPALVAAARRMEAFTTPVPLSDVEMLPDPDYGFDAGDGNHPQRSDADDGLRETERRHSADCRAQEAQRQREADILQAGYAAGRASIEAELTALRESLKIAQEQNEKLTSRKGNVANRFEQYVGSLVSIARQHGYALGVHGSLERDIDLIAAPWTEAASAPDVLIEAMRQAVDGYIRNDPHHDAYDETATNPVRRPHGRLAWSIYPSSGVTYFDVSVMPRSTEIADLEAQLKIAQEDARHRCSCWFNEDGRLQEWCKTHAEVLDRAELAEAQVKTAAQERESAIRQFQAVEKEIQALLAARDRLVEKWKAIEKQIREVGLANAGTKKGAEAAGGMTVIRRCIEGISTLGDQA